LEDALGVSLFERRSRGMVLTQAGLKYLDAVRRVLLDLSEASGQARQAGSGIIGRLAIGTYFSLSTGVLRDLIVAFLRRHPDAGIAVLEGSREELVEAVRDGRADVAPLLGSRDEPGLERLELWHEAVLIALPDDHRLAHARSVKWTELAHETFLIMRHGSGVEVQALIQNLLPAGHRARFAVQDVSREVMVNLVGTTKGVALLAASAAGVRYPGVVFRPVGDERGRTTIQVTAHWDRQRDHPPLRRFLASLRATQGSRGGN
jgi:DNA-binding transcriptional LysR family regulator